MSWIWSGRRWAFIRASSAGGEGPGAEQPDRGPVGVVDTEQGLASDRGGDLGCLPGLVVRGMAHVRHRYGLELLDRQPAGKVGQEPIERGPAQRAERPVLETHVHVEMVRDELEVDDACRLLGGALLRPALDVQPHEQPADDADQRPERTDEELLEIHPVTAPACPASYASAIASAPSPPD